MSIEEYQINIRGLAVDVVCKDIKNLHIGVYPPAGRVRVASPRRVTKEAVRLAVIGRLGWIKWQQAKFESQPRQSERRMVSGETHYFLGRRFRLEVVTGDTRPQVRVGASKMEQRIRTGTTAAERYKMLQVWYRRELRKRLPQIVEKWQNALGVSAVEVRIKRMKTRWGTCSKEAARIWVNLELVKKPVTCIEYIVVHELVHLIERRHNDRFVALMDKHMSLWRHYRDQLNAAPLAHETWDY
jgi:predicted metal-dependent hydrolase